MGYFMTWIEIKNKKIVNKMNNTVTSKKLGQIE